MNSANFENILNKKSRFYTKVFDTDDISGVRLAKKRQHIVNKVRMLTAKTIKAVRLF